MTASSTAESTRNQENYQYIGNQKSPLNGKEIVLLVLFIELSTSLPESVSFF